MKRIINIVTLFVFCSLFIRASFAQQEIPSVWSYKEYLEVKQTILNESLAQNHFVTPSLMCERYDNDSKGYEKNVSNKLLYIYGNVIQFELGKAEFENNIVFKLYLEISPNSINLMKIQLPLNLSDNSKNKIMRISKGDKFYFLVKAKKTPMVNEAISVLNEAGENEVLFGKDFAEMSYCQYNVPSKNTVNVLQNKLEKQQCYDYKVSIFEAINKYFEDKITMLEALNPKASFDDEEMVKQIMSTIVGKNKIINTGILKEKGFLKDNPNNKDCIYYSLNDITFSIEIPIGCSVHGIEDIPCSLYIEAISDGVRDYNKSAGSKMNKLDLQSLIRNGFVKENPYFSKCLFTSEGDLTKDGYIKCLVHEKSNKIETSTLSQNTNKTVQNTETNSNLNINTENLSFQIPMEETQAYKEFMKDLKDNPKSVSEQRKENATSYKISVDLKPSNGLEALKIAKMVQEFYSNYFINEIIRNEPANWFVTEHRVVPSTRRLLRLLSYVDWSVDYIICGNDIPLIWKINNVVINNELAEVKIKRFWSENDKEFEEIVIICKKINGNWLIDDIVDLNVNSSVKKSFYSFFNRNQNLAVVKGKKLPVYSKVYGERTISFYDTNNRILALFKSDSKNSFNIDFEAGTNLSGKIDSNNMDSDWSVNAENIISFNFFNKIKKGEDKYMAYIVLGEPSEDSSNKLFYSPDDYISYDKEDKITSWNGFEDLKEFFDDGTDSDKQNIGYITAKSGINLREEPNTKSEKVCGFPYNTQVMILDYNGPKATFENITSNWYLITDGTRVGWAFGGFIRAK